MAENENKEAEQEELKLSEEILENKSEHCERNKILQLRLQETTSAYKMHLMEFWEKIQWDNYLYGTKEMDCFQLPVINAFLSEWKDEENFDEELILKNCRECLKIIDNLNFAIAVCVDATERKQNLWKEGIKNLKETVMDKLNYLTFMLLKNGKKYINPKTQNVEYGIKDNDDDCFITLCLWANLYAAVRKEGMSMLGFCFKLPADIVQENCSVRIINTLFEQISIQDSMLRDKIKLDEKDVGVFEDNEEVGDANEIMESIENTIEIIEDKKEGEISVDEEINPSNEAENKDVTQANNTLSVENAKEIPQIERKESSVSENKIEIQTRLQLNAIDLNAFDPSLLPPLSEPEIEIIDPDEYFIVGGTFHFDLLTVPKPNVRKGSFTYLHREKPELKRIRYKRKIVLPRTFDDDDVPPIISAYEKKRFRHELKNAIFIQLQLPNKVMYLSTPEPARLFLEKGGYSTDCIFCTDYKSDSRQISFKTNQFGMFGMLQKKYQNLPYKEWMLKASDSITLSLSGSKLDIDIGINIHGYTVTLLHPDNHLISSEIDSTWMVCDLLIQKLLSVGINIVIGDNVDKFVDISKKEKLLEDKVYDCMALLCTCVSFMSISKLSLSKDEIVLKYTTKKESKVRKVLIRSNIVFDYEEEEKRILKDEAALKRNLEIEDLGADNLENENITDEKVIEKDAFEAAPKIEDAIQENEPVFYDLYHYVLHGMDGTEKEAVMNTNVCLIERVRTLLKMCRPISSM